MKLRCRKSVSVARRINVAKNRERQKANKRKEERLNLKTEWGVKDPTPKEAVENIRREKWSLNN